MGKLISQEKVTMQSKGLIICDDASKMTWVEMGWPGSIHNNWVWSNSDLYLSKDQYFNNKEYLLGDLAFSGSSVLFPALLKACIPTLVKSRDISTQSWRKFESRASIA